MSDPFPLSDSEVATLKTIVMDICDGNPGAINALMALVTSQPDGVDLVRKVKQRGLRGSDIWVEFKDRNGGEPDRFAASLREPTPERAAS